MTAWHPVSAMQDVLVCVFVFLPRGLPVSSDLYRKKGNANIQLHLGPFQAHTCCLPEAEELC